MQLTLSNMNKTWIFDLDGTIVKHNGYLNGEEEILDGVLETFQQISETDMIIILSARKERYRNQTVDFLKKNNIRYDYLLFDMPYGERIIVNDEKKSGLKTAVAINKKRDSALNIRVRIDNSL